MHYSCEFNEEERGSIAIGLRDIEDASGNCAKFRPATTADKDWVAIDHKKSGCSASLGFNRHYKRSHLSLATDCITGDWGRNTSVD